jgi:hypothetical protein
MDLLTISTNFVAKPNGSTIAPAVGTLPPGDATVSLPSSQTSKHSSSILGTKSASRPNAIRLVAKPPSSPAHDISMPEPEAANLKSASTLTRQMTEASEKLSKGGAADSDAGFSLKVT